MMRLDENNSCIISEDDMIFVWEPGSKDKIYRLGIVLGKENGEHVNPFEQPHLKVMFAGSGKVYNFEEIDKECFFPYYVGINGKACLVNGNDCKLNYVDNLLHTNYVSAHFWIEENSRQSYPRQFRLIISYLNKKISPPYMEWASWIYLKDKERKGYNYYLQFPFNKVKEIDAEIVGLQKKLFEKQAKSLTQKLKNKYLEAEQERQ